MKTKQLLIVLLAAGLVLSASGCGENTLMFFWTRKSSWASRRRICGWTSRSVCISGADSSEPTRTQRYPCGSWMPAGTFFCTGPSRKGKSMVYCVERNLILEEQR